MSKSYTARYIIPEGKSILTEVQKKAFEKEFSETSETQASYEEIIIKLMEKKGIDASRASELTRLNKSVFTNLEKPGGSIQKRFVISIAVGFQLDVHLTEYILESCGMRFMEASKVDKAYIYILENYKGKDIETCNGVLRELGIEGKYMLGELDRGSYNQAK